MSEKKKSYTQNLIDFLNLEFAEMKGKERKTLDRIQEAVKTFSKQQRAIIEEEQEKNKGLMTFGKYKGEKILDIHKKDSSYIVWLSKNDKYLTNDSKLIVQNLLE